MSKAKGLSIMGFEHWLTEMRDRDGSPSKTLASAMIHSSVTRIYVSAAPRFQATLRVVGAVSRWSSSLPPGAQRILTWVCCYKAQELTLVTLPFLSLRSPVCNVRASLAPAMEVWFPVCKVRVSLVEQKSQ